MTALKKENNSLSSNANSKVQDPGKFIAENIIFSFFNNFLNILLSRRFFFFVSIILFFFSCTVWALYGENGVGVLDFVEERSVG